MMLCMVEGMSTTTLHAQKKTFVRDYTYQACEDDSKLTARANAIAEMWMREQLAGVTLKTTTFPDSTDGKEIKILIDIPETMNIVDERWNDSAFYLKAKIDVDVRYLQRAMEAPQDEQEQAPEAEIESESHTELMEGDVYVGAQIFQRQKKTVVRDYACQSDHLTTRAKALSELWNELLREQLAGVMLKARPTLRDSVAYNHIDALINGAVVMNIMDERWEDNAFYLKAKIDVDVRYLEQWTVETAEAAETDPSATTFKKEMEKTREEFRRRIEAEKVKKDREAPHKSH